MIHADLNAIENLRSKIKSIRFGMFTTVNSDKSLSSRPMTQQELDDNGVLWFFLSDDTQLARDIVNESKVNVTFAEPSDSIYVAVSGTADIIKNRSKVEQLWSPAVAAWFPDGINDPHLSLIKFTINNAEYWDVHSNKMAQLYAMVKAAVGGEPPKDNELGKHEKIEF